MNTPNKKIKGLRMMTVVLLPLLICLLTPTEAVMKDRRGKSNVNPPSKSGAPAGQIRELSGHITLVRCYDLPAYRGCYAILAIPATPGTNVAIFTRNAAIQMLLTQALATGNRVDVYAIRDPSPPYPMGGKLNLEAYDTSSVILYNSR